MEFSTISGMEILHMNSLEPMSWVPLRAARGQEVAWRATLEAHRGRKWQREAGRQLERWERF